MKRAPSLEPIDAATYSAVPGLLGELSTEELEPIAIEVILEHRRRLQRAQELFEMLERTEREGATMAELRQLRQDYAMATLNLHGHHHLVSLVVAALRYVPVVNSEPPDGSPSH